jgi:hypothetical protein
MTPKPKLILDHVAFCQLSEDLRREHTNKSIHNALVTGGTLFMQDDLCVYWITGKVVDSIHQN